MIQPLANQIHINQNMHIAANLHDNVLNKNLTTQAAGIFEVEKKLKEVQDINPVEVDNKINADRDAREKRQYEGREQKEGDDEDESPEPAPQKTKSDEHPFLDIMV